MTEGMELRGGAAPPPPPPPPAVRLGWSVPTAEDKVVTARERQRNGDFSFHSSSTEEPGVHVCSPSRPARALRHLLRRNRLRPPVRSSHSRSDSDHNNRSGSSCHPRSQALCPGALTRREPRPEPPRQAPRRLHPVAPSRGQAGGCSCARRGGQGSEPTLGPDRQTAKGSNFLAVPFHLCPWASAFTSLVFSSLIWKMGIIIEPTS